MKLGELFEGVSNKYSEFVSMYQYINTNEFSDLGIAGITDDSRKVKPGYLFVAIKGLEHDGHDYIKKALEAGAVAVMYEEGARIPEGEYVAIKTLNNRHNLGLLWAAWYGFPSEKLKVIGITGTDGKTTTTNFLYHILKNSGRKVGMISTINARFGDKEIDTGFHVTSPEPELLQKLLSQMVTGGLEYVCLEVTSHGLDQQRVAGVKFFGAAVTNVTHEHLDYHKTYQNYLETKGRLFSDVKFSVLNGDDESFSYLKSVSSGKKVSYGLKDSPAVLAEKVELSGSGSKFQLKIAGEGAKINLKLPGLYNVANALAAVAAALELGLTVTEIKAGLESFSGLEGRFEEIKEGQAFAVIVDFAHTPNALEQVLKLSSKIKDQKSKLIVVFGCAGERDKGKRQMMGEISGRIADLSLLTAEDPRRENLDDIIDHIASGCLTANAAEIFNFPARTDTRSVSGRQFSIFNSGDKEQEKHFFARVPDRRKAIETALKVAKAGDIVIITGKGHEKSMCFGATEYPWSDQQTARTSLKDLT